MKKILLLTGILVTLVFPVVGEATAVDVYESMPVSQTQGISPRALYSYLFPYVPPKTFNGRTRIYYEYVAKEKVYIGYYQ